MSRSGTTFLGKSLALDESTALYVHEPVKLLLQNKYASVKEDKPEFWSYVFQDNKKKLKVHYLVCVVLNNIITGKIKSGGVLCIKPITMIDCMQEVSDTLKCSVVYISRHPCGYADSMKRQALAYHDHSSAGVFDNQRLESLGYGWGEKNKAILDLFSKNEHWIWVVFEDVCLNSASMFKDIYRRLRIEWTEEVEAKLLKMTNTPSDAFYGTNRKSSGEAEKWKKSLSEEEIEAVKSGSLKHKTGIYDGF